MDELHLDQHRKHNRRVLVSSIFSSWEIKQEPKENVKIPSVIPLSLSSVYRTAMSHTDQNLERYKGWKLINVNPHVLQDSNWSKPK